MSFAILAILEAFMVSLILLASSGSPAFADDPRPSSVNASSAAATAPAQGVPAIASAVRLTNGKESASLSFVLDRPVKASGFVLAKPDRVVIDLPEVDFRIDPQVGAASHIAGHDHSKAGSAGLVDSFRFGLFAVDRSRIVINLAGPAKITRIATEPQASGSSTRLVVRLAKTTSAAFAAAARKEMLAMAHQAEPAPPPSPSLGLPGLPVIVIDPGHGGIDSGAMVKGLLEKNIVLAFGKTLSKKLEETGRYKVVMTRDKDIFIPLNGRVRIARDAHAALFVSIHADTITTDTQEVSGATVYTLSHRASDAEAARTAEKENQSDATAGVDDKAQPAKISDILLDLTKQETRAYSHIFARTLVNHWKLAARLNKNPERSAGFVVLTAPDVPSILLELGYLSNPEDAKCLVSPKWRDKAADEVVAAINAFFDEKGTPAEAQMPGTVDTAAAAVTK